MYIPQIIQGIGLIKYTPNSGTIPMNFGTMFLTEDCIMSVTDHFDHDEDDVPFKAGYHPLMFKKIRSISTGSVYLCHNGKQPTLSEIINDRPSQYLSEINEYAARVFSEGGLLLESDKVLLNSFVHTLKPNGIWDKIKDCGFFFGGFAGSKVKLKYANAGLENLVLDNFVESDYSESLGLKSTTASNKKCLTGVIPSNHGLSNTNYSMGYFMTEPNIQTNYYFMLDNQPTGLANVVVGTLEIKAGSSIGSIPAQTTVPNFSALSLATSKSITMRDYLNYLSPNIVSPPVIPLNTEISLFFGRNNGVNLYSRGAVSFYYIGEYLSYDELVILSNAVRQVLIGKGRYVEAETELFGYGDSITHGSSATVPYRDRYLALLSSSLGLRERNLGRSGSRLTHNASTTPGGHPTMTQIGSYPTAGGDSKIIIQYGVNDVLENTGDASDASVATFQTELTEVVEYCQSIGFKNENIQVGSISYLTGGTITETGKQKFVTAARNAAMSTGVKYVDVYNYMKNNGGASLLIADGIHPNNLGYAAMAYAHEHLAQFINL